MVTIAIAVVGVALLAFPGLAARHAWLRPPAEWARVAAAALAGGALTLYIGLVLLALPAVLRTANLEGVASICEPIVGWLGAGGPLVGWLATALVAVTTALGIGALRRARRAALRARIEPWIGDHVDHGDYELVVLPTPVLVAVGVPGPRPQVVVSRGLVDELDEWRLDAVIGHEVAHHRLGHRRYLLLAALVERVFGLLPFVRGSARALRDAIEQWADAAASVAWPARASALPAAMMSVTRAGSGGGCARLSPSLATRALRLHRRAPRATFMNRAIVYAPACVLALSAVLLVADWLTVSHHAVAWGSPCPA